ncbi:MAG: hypothetical protein WAX07_01160 [Candidatus Altiarchaeia archaeon]|jgi:Arc/MetJ-type ribon-helix-helix transcriptional regulator
MKSNTFTVRLKGDVADVVDELVSRGYSESKTEAIRTSLVFYGMQLGLITPKKLHKKVLGDIKKSGKKYSDKEIEAQLKGL